MWKWQTLKPTCLYSLYVRSYLVEVGVDTLVEVGVDTLDDVEADDDVETELDVDTLERNVKS